MKTTNRKPTPMYGVVSASRIIGEAVVNREDETLGKIHELVIDAKEGRLAYAVLSFGGLLGLGTKLFAVPWGAFEFSNSENKLILNVDADKLKDAPGFDKDAEWPLVSTMKINVDTDDGKVTLSETVPSEVETDQAVLLTGSADGVKSSPDARR